MMFHDPTAAALYAGILDHPHDTLRRLILADRLEEIGGTVPCWNCDGKGRVTDIERYARYEPGPAFSYWWASSVDGSVTYDAANLVTVCNPCGGSGVVPDATADRAEFIRLMCEPTSTLSEAQVDRIRRLLFTHGNQWFRDLTRQYPTVTFVTRRGFPDEIHCPWDWWFGGACGRCSNWMENQDCPNCDGTGDTPGHGEEVVRRWPVTKVVVTDSPLWNRNRSVVGPEEWVLAGQYYGQPCDQETWKTFSDPDEGWPYESEQAAIDKLCPIVLNLTRSRVGLPPLPVEATA